LDYLPEYLERSHIPQDVKRAAREMKDNRLTTRRRPCVGLKTVVPARMWLTEYGATRHMIGMAARARRKKEGGEVSSAKAVAPHAPGLRRDYHALLRHFVRVIKGTLATEELRID
jgi:hypothetical protein